MEVRYIKTEYERKLKAVFKDIADETHHIQDQDEWDQLVVFLQKDKLITVDETEVMDHFMPSFPCDFPTFINTVTQSFGDIELKRLENCLDDTQE